MKALNHAERIKDELKKAGITKYGLMKSESRHLIQLIHEKEHIGGVVYGQYSGGSAMLIATDHRVIFLDTKPLFKTFDELTYDVVAGVKLETAGLLDTVVLHTRVNDYTIRYANKKCARQFVKYIESRRLERDYNKPEAKLKVDKTALYPTPFNDPEAVKFLKEHDIAVMASIDRTGNVNNSVVYYIVDQSNRIYILTKQETAKARNVLAHNQVAMTIFEAHTARTMNLQGIAEFETKEDVKQYVFSQIVKPRPYDGEMSLPPITLVDKGAFTVLRITPTSGKYTDYKKLSK